MLVGAKSTQCSTEEAWIEFNHWLYPSIPVAREAQYATLDCLSTPASEASGERLPYPSTFDSHWQYNFWLQHRENNVWVVGSGDISLNIMVINEDEPAYQTQITVGITPGSRLRRTIEFCKMSTESFSLICDVGNPLVKGKPVRYFTLSQ